MNPVIRLSTSALCDYTLRLLQLTIINLQPLGQEDLGVISLQQSNQCQWGTESKDQIMLQLLLLPGVVKVQRPIVRRRQAENLCAVDGRKGRHVFSMTEINEDEEARNNSTLGMQKS
jgi:hypothetical protein